jgi:hypothetical protein
MDLLKVFVKNQHWCGYQAFICYKDGASVTWWLVLPNRRSLF